MCTTSGVARRRVRQPGTDTQGASPALRRWRCGRQSGGNEVSRGGRRAVSARYGDDGTFAPVGWRRPHASMLPVTGAWRPSDPTGDRQFMRTASTATSCSRAAASLRDITVAYETWGDARRRRAATPSSSATPSPATATPPGRAGPRPSRRAGWWDGADRPGPAIDTDRYFVVCANVLGGCQGTTGPASPQPGPGRPLRLPLPGRDRPRHGAGAGRGWPTTSASTAGSRSSAARWAACRCSSGA